MIATPDTLKSRKMVETARMLNPRIEILLRTHTDEEAELLRGENLGRAFMGEHELALAMTRDVLGHVDLTRRAGPGISKTPTTT